MDSRDVQLIEDIAGFYDKPLAFVLYAFAWGEGPLRDAEGPDVWQREALAKIGERLRDGGDAGEAIRLAVASGHGIGKSALIAWIVLWFMSTREHPQVVVTANTQPQLSTKTWRELAKWHNLAINRHWFKWTATRFSHVEHPETWFASAIPWSEHNAEAFAGTHEKYVLVLYDEGSAIADIIWETTEGAMTTPGAMWVAFGNPTRTTGKFRECFGSMRHRWITMQVDSRTSRIANQAQIAQWIEDYGEDSDFVRVRVRGVFPRASSAQFIEQDLVDDCHRYKAEGYLTQPVILGLDVARFGDDQTVLVRRQGRHWKVLQRWRGLDTVNVGARVAAVLDEEEVDAIVIDGDGVGAGVIDYLRARNYDRRDGRDILHEFHGAGTPEDPQRYFNRRAEVWGLMREAMRAGVELPRDVELDADLTGPEYFFTHRSGHDVIQLESKKDMKRRGLSSPDAADAFAMVYAVKIRESGARRRSSYDDAVRGAGARQHSGWMR